MSNEQSPRFHVDGTLPEEGHIFVFGSNEAGRHGAGAAKAAKVHFGAHYGVGRGPSGQSYAIPTKDKNLKTLPLDAIAQSVEDFLRYAKIFPEKRFFVTRIGCQLAGYANEDIAPLFANAPPNCSFAKEWRPYIRDAKPLPIDLRPDPRPGPY